jgi:serine/threonine protein kinase
MSMHALTFLVLVLFSTKRSPGGRLFRVKPPRPLIAITGEEPSPIAAHAPDASMKLQQVIDKALRKSKDERYQSIEDMRRDLENPSDQARPSTTGAVQARTTSSAKHIVDKISRPKLIAAVGQSPSDAVGEKLT